MREFVDSIGFRFLHFAALNTCVIFNSHLINRCLPKGARAERILRIFLLSVSQIVLLVLCHGLFGALGLYELTCSVLIITLVLSWATRNVSQESGKSANLIEKPGRKVFEKTIIFLALAVFFFGFYLEAYVPPLGTDAYIYHLTFPVQWMKAGSLIRTATVFHEPAPTYSPMNGEFFYAWLMIALKSDIIAANGQFIFLPFAALAIYLIFARVGLSQRLALGLAAFFFLSRPFFQELDIAYVDLISLSFYLSGIYFLLNLKSGWRSLLFFSISLGLFAGAKYVNLIYLAALSPFMIYGLLSSKKKALQDEGLEGRRGAWIFGALLCFAALSGYSYIRNLIETGNPFFPSDFSLFGIRIFSGMFNPGSLIEKESGLAGIIGVFIAPQEKYSPGAIAGGLLLLVSILAVIKSGLRKEPGPLLLALSPFIAGALYFFYSPFRDYRLLFPLYAGLYINAGIVFRSFLDRKYVREIFIVLLVAIALFEMWAPITAGWAFAEKITALLVFCIIVALLFVITGAAALWKLALSRMPQKASFIKTTTVAALMIFAIYFVLGLWNVYFKSYEARRYIYISDRWADFGKCWRWLHENEPEKNLRVACTGTQMIYPLFDKEFKNDVFYISVQKRRKHYFHEFGVRFDKPMKAMLVHEAHKVFEKNPDFASWYERLRGKNIDYIFVAGSDRIENRWIMREPDKFVAEFSSGDVKIVKIAR